MIQFQSSVVAGDILRLPNPKLGDSATINWKRINRTSRGNDLILDVPDANWKPEFLVRFDWDYMKETEHEALKRFVTRHTGLPVFLTDHYGQVKKVIFLRPDSEFPQVGRENWSTTLDMQIVQ